MTDPQGFALADLLLGLGASSEMDSAGAELECPTCGFSQADFKKDGPVGLFCLLHCFCRASGRDAETDA